MADLDVPGSPDEYSSSMPVIDDDELNSIVPGWGKSPAKAGIEGKAGSGVGGSEAANAEDGSTAVGVLEGLAPRPALAEVSNNNPWPSAVGPDDAPRRKPATPAVVNLEAVPPRRPFNRLEYAASSRAKCHGKNCKQTKNTIQYGTLRKGHWIPFRQGFWGWRHWGCVTRPEIAKWKKEVYGDPVATSGWSTLRPDAQDQVRKAFELGHVPDAEFSGLQLKPALAYKIEYSPTSKAACQNPTCQKANSKILKKEIRLGLMKETTDRVIWSYKHWRCTTPDEMEWVLERTYGDGLIGIYDLNAADRDHVAESFAEGQVRDKTFRGSKISRWIQQPEEAARREDNTNTAAKKLKREYKSDSDDEPIPKVDLRSFEYVEIKQEQPAVNQEPSQIPPKQEGTDVKIKQEGNEDHYGPSDDETYFEVDMRTPEPVGVKREARTVKQEPSQSPAKKNATVATMKEESNEEYYGLFDVPEAPNPAVKKESHWPYTETTTIKTEVSFGDVVIKEEAISGSKAKTSPRPTKKRKF